MVVTQYYIGRDSPSCAKATKFSNVWSFEKYSPHELLGKNTWKFTAFNELWDKTMGQGLGKWWDNSISGKAKSVKIEIRFKKL